MKKVYLYLKKTYYLPDTRGLLSKRLKFLRIPTQKSLLIFSLAMSAKFIVIFNVIFILNWKILQKRNKKICTKVFKVFRHCHVQHMCKISGKNSKFKQLQLVGALGSFYFLNEIHCF